MKADHKIIIYIVILFLIGCSSRVQTEEEKLHQLVLKNKIKSITEFRTESHLGINQKEVNSHVELFNERGLRTKETIFNTDGNIDVIITYEYDKNENLTVAKAVSKDNSLVYKKTFSYDVHDNRNELYFY